MPEISVIMGVYNSPNKSILKQAIESILNQTFTDFEFIICDDGSIDDTFDFLLEYKKKNKKIILIKNKKNSGLAATLNHCLKYANGVYIARMDGDDISRPDRLEKEINFLKNNSAYGFVGSEIKLIDEYSGVWGKRDLIREPKSKDFLFTQPFVHASVLVKKEIYDKVNGYRVSKETLRAEDYDLFMRLYSLGIVGYNLEEYLYLVREDKNAYRRRKYRYRFDEAKVRYIGFKSLGLLPRGYIYILKPFIVGIIPQRLLAKIRR